MKFSVLIFNRINEKKIFTNSIYIRIKESFSIEKIRITPINNNEMRNKFEKFLRKKTLKKSSKRIRIIMDIRVYSHNQKSTNTTHTHKTQFTINRMHS